MDLSVVKCTASPKMKRKNISIPSKPNIVNNSYLRRYGNSPAMIRRRVNPLNKFKWRKFMNRLQFSSRKNRITVHSPIEMHSVCIICKSIQYKPQYVTGHTNKILVNTLPGPSNEQYKQSKNNTKHSDVRLNMTAKLKLNQNSRKTESMQDISKDICLTDNSKLLKSKVLKKVLFPVCNIVPISNHTQIVYIVERMRSISDREHSFRNWSSMVSPSKLINAGFFCVNERRGIVKCFSCEISFNVKHLNGEEPLEYHRRLSPDCNFLSQIQTPERENSQNSLETDGLVQQTVGISSNSMRKSMHGKQATDSQNISSKDIVTDISEIPRQTPLEASGFSRIDGQLSNCKTKTDSTTTSTAACNPQKQSAPTDSSSRSYTLSPVNQTCSQHSTTRRRTRVRTPEQENENNRKSSFTNWPRNSFQNTELLVECGFYFTGSEDIVRCFHCDIGIADWNNEDNPWVEHARHSPECPYLLDRKGQQYVDSVQREWETIYNPKHGHLRELKDRLKTFTNWPQDQVTQTPRQLAEAGFFFIGEGDTVRCHYCDGGLREWEPLDDPWMEHARWFPFCKYVMRVKGLQFIRNAATGSNNNDGESQPPVSNLPASFANATQGACSYEEECRKKELKNPLYTAAAQSVMTMDYSKSDVTMAINIYIARTGRRDFHGTDLMNILFELDENRSQEFQTLAENSLQQDCKPLLGDAGVIDDDTSAVGGEVEEFIFTPEALIKENERLTSLFICVKCSIKERQILNVPCGHRMTCESCSVDEEFCSHCSAKITKKVKTYFG